MPIITLPPVTQTPIVLPSTHEERILNETDPAVPGCSGTSTNTPSLDNSPRIDTLQLEGLIRNFLTTSDPATVPPSNPGIKLERSAMIIIKNVHTYLSKLCSNPGKATAAACGVGRNLVRKACKENGSIDSNDQEKRKSRGVIIDSMDTDTIRRIVHEFYKRNEYPTIQKLLAEIKDSLDGRFPYGETFLRNLLNKMGFKYKFKSHNLHVMYERKDIVHWRLRYLRDIRRYRQGNRPIIFLDETWYTCHDSRKRGWEDTVANADPYKTIQAGSSLMLGPRTPSGRGRRLIIVNAVSRDGLVPNAFWVFKSTSTVSPEDYHKEMDAHNFEIWFKEKLLPNIPDNSVIVMDNAPYHSRKSVKLSLSGRRDDVIATLKKLNFFKFLANRHRDHDPNQMTMKVIFALCKEYRDIFDKYAIEEILEDLEVAKRGITILRLPPYHCIFNPIEMIWAYQKDLVRKQATTFKIDDVKKKCEECFSQLPAKGANGYFDHIEKTVEPLHWERDGLKEEFHPSVIVTLDSDSDSGSDDSSSCDSDDENVDLPADFFDFLNKT